MARRRVAVLISGSGSNLQALLEDTALAGRHSSIELVLSNNPDAYGLTRAARAEVPAHTIDHRRFGDRAGFERAMEERLQAAGIELVCLAGFMRVLTGDFVERWRDRLVNIHPSLLPAFPGLDTHRRAIEAGALISGCTVHMVRSKVDSGPVIAQALVRVHRDQSPAELARSVLAMEHRVYPVALELLASGRLEVMGERVVASDDLAEAARLVIDPELSA